MDILTSDKLQCCLASQGSLGMKETVSEVSDCITHCQFALDLLSCQRGVVLVVTRIRGVTATTPLLQALVQQRVVAETNRISAYGRASTVRQRYDQAVCSAGAYLSEQVCGTPEHFCAKSRPSQAQSAV